MGSMPRLKEKDLYRYRKGSTAEHMNCRHCQHFTTITIHPDIREGRCQLLGVKESRRYRVREDYTCDRHVVSDAYKTKVNEWMKGVRG